MGAFAVEKLIEGESGIMVGIESNKVVTHPISYAWEQKKTIDAKDYDLALILSE